MIEAWKNTEMERWRNEWTRGYYTGSKRTWAMSLVHVPAFTVLSAIRMGPWTLFTTLNPQTDYHS